MFFENKTHARKKYREFMMEKDGFERSDVYAFIDQRLKGDEEFVDRILEQHDKEPVKHRKQKRKREMAINKSFE